MAAERLFGFDPKRHLAYSEWHRAPSLGRFIHNAADMSMFDVDAVEIDKPTNTPVALIETTTGALGDKTHTWTAALGRMSSVPAYVVACRLADVSNPASTLGALDIASFEVLRLDDKRKRQMSPREYAEWLVDLRRHPRLKVAA